MTRLSGRILKPSQQKYFEEKFTDSLEDIPVSPSVVRGSEKEKMTQGTYGHTSESMSGQLDLFGASLKMSEATPRWGYGESCPIWKKMVTERSGDCSARRKQARLTNASECSSWQNYPTPAARDYKGTNSEDHVMNKSKGYKGHMNQLPNFIKYGLSQERWLTPTTTDIVRSPEGMEKRKQYRESIGRKYVEGCLSEQVDNQQNWPTPRAGNPGSRKPGTGGKILAEEAKKNWATPNTMDYLPPKTGEALARNKKKGGCKNLREDVNNPSMNWPTASASDTEGGSQADRVEWTEKGATLRKKNKPHMTYGAKLRDAVENHEHAGPPAQEKSSTSGKNHGSPKLNPNWVEQLMGLPIGWTDLGSWATESSHKQQN
jgi:hypothetical protein